MYKNSALVIVMPFILALPVAAIAYFMLHSLLAAAIVCVVTALAIMILFFIWTIKITKICYTNIDKYLRKINMQDRVLNDDDIFGHIIETDFGELHMGFMPKSYLPKNDDVDGFYIFCIDILLNLRSQNILKKSQDNRDKKAGHSGHKYMRKEIENALTMEVRDFIMDAAPANIKAGIDKISVQILSEKGASGGKAKDENDGIHEKFYGSEYSIVFRVSKDTALNHAKAVYNLIAKIKKEFGAPEDAEKRAIRIISSYLSGRAAEGAEGCNPDLQGNKR